MQLNDYGRTALHYAAMQGNYYACTVLVHAGAPVDAKDFTTIPDPMGGGLLVGASAAFHAALWKKNEWEKVVKLDLFYWRRRASCVRVMPTRSHVCLYVCFFVCHCV